MSVDYTSPESWLLSMGYMSDNTQQNLVLYGYLAVPGVQAVECAVDSPSGTVRYVVALEQSSWRWYKLQTWFASKTNILFKLALLLLLRRKGTYEPHARISRCVKDYLGQEWSAAVEVISVREYNKLVSGPRKQGWFLQEGDGPGTEPR